MIVWNYKELLDEIINTKSFNDRKKIVCLVRSMAKSGLQKGNIEDSIKQICKDENDYSILKKQISNECKRARKDKSFIREKIVFSDGEIATLKTITDNGVQRVLFWLMVYCKSRGMNYIYLGSKSETKPKDITDVARVPYSLKRFNLIMRELYNRGTIIVEPNMKVVLPMIQISETTGQEVEVSKNSIEWLEILAGRGIYCQRCGRFVKKQGNNKKYCPECAEIVKKERDKFRKLKN